MGRRPKATALKLLHGNPGKRKLNDREPKPEPIEPVRPGLLTKGGATYWEDIVAKTMKMKVLTEADGLSLANLCNDLYTLEQINLSLETEGRKITNPISGATKTNPLVAQQSELVRRTNAALSIFGCDPVGRVRLKTIGPDKAEQDEFDLDA